jgi:hypothetical protein
MEQAEVGVGLGVDTAVEVAGGILVKVGGEVGVSGVAEGGGGVDVASGVEVFEVAGVSVAVGAWAVSSACTVWATAVSRAVVSGVDIDVEGNRQAKVVTMRVAMISDKAFFLRIGISLLVNYRDPHSSFIVTHFSI